MRCFLYLVWLGVLVVSAESAEQPSLYQQNKQALERTVKMYLAYEARHEMGPGTDADLALPRKAQFQRVAGIIKPWVYPMTLGLEIKIGEGQKRVIVLSPSACCGRYFVGTDDLQVQSYSKKDIQPVLDAIAARRKKLSMKPLD